jgi:hypothetical protein
MRSLLFPELLGIVESLLRPAKAVGLDVEGFVVGIGGKHLFFLPPHWLGCFAQDTYEIAHGYHHPSGSLSQNSPMV